MLVDAHAHFDQYTEHLDEAISQINDHQIFTVGVSMDIGSYLRTLELSKRSTYLKPAFGIHPWEASRYSTRLGDLDNYLIQTPMIGEAGLDFYYVKDRSLYEPQKAVFEYECEWAGRLGKIMNLHTKGAEKEVIETLDRFKLNGSIIHWYSGPIDLIEDYLAAGCYFTIGVEVLSSTEIEEIAREIPIDRLLLETDNPGGIEWYTNSIGMPVLIYDVLAKVAAVKGIDPSEMKKHLSVNWLNITEKIKEFQEPGE